MYDGIVQVHISFRKMPETSISNKKISMTLNNTLIPNSKYVPYPESILIINRKK